MRPSRRRNAINAIGRMSALRQNNLRYCAELPTHAVGKNNANGFFVCELEFELEKGIVAQTCGHFVAADQTLPVKCLHRSHDIEALQPERISCFRKASPVLLGCLNLTWTSAISPLAKRPRRTSSGILITGGRISSCTAVRFVQRVRRGAAALSFGNGNLLSSGTCVPCKLHSAIASTVEMPLCMRAWKAK